MFAVFMVILLQYPYEQTALQLNIAACQHALAEYVRAIEWADKVLGDQPNHAKALYRRGMAHIFTGDFDDARADFQRVGTILML